MKEAHQKVRHSDKEMAYFIEMLCAEGDYRAKTSGDKDSEPFVMPLLFRIHGTLRSILYLLSCGLASILVLLLGILAKL